jgi:hypothetical protein
LVIAEFLTMRPAFSSIKTASAFALLLLGIFLLPFLLRGRLLPPQRENYLLQGWDTTGDYPWLYRQIFKEKGDIDIAFVGSSRLWLGIDTVYVQQKLSEQLGRPAVVRTIAWGGAGYDALYFATQDLLQNRRVRVLVFNDECQAYNVPNPYARRWFRLGENGSDLTGFPLRIRLDYYFAAILGLPRNLLDWLRPNLPYEPTAADIALREKTYYCTNPAARLGSVALQQGFSRSPVFQDGHPRFERFTPDTGANPTDAIVYSAATKAMFQFSDSPLPAWQAHFAKKFAALVAEKHSRLVLLHVPELTDAGQSAIPEREFWPETLQMDVTLLGIPPKKLFAGLNDEEIYKLFGEPYHLNQNGQEYFTWLITPALLKIYETSTNR